MKQANLPTLRQSPNLKRRHLSESQRAAVATELANMPAHRPPNKCADLHSSPSVTLADAADLLNVSRSLVADAKAIERTDPSRWRACCTCCAIPAVASPATSNPACTHAPPCYPLADETCVATSTPGKWCPRRKRAHQFWPMLAPAAATCYPPGQTRTVLRPSSRTRADKTQLWPMLASERRHAAPAGAPARRWTEQGRQPKTNPSSRTRGCTFLGRCWHPCAAVLHPLAGQGRRRDESRCR